MQKDVSVVRMFRHIDKLKIGDFFLVGHGVKSVGYRHKRIKMPPVPPPVNNIFIYYAFLCFEIFNNIPASTKVIIKEEPPLLTKTKGIPVSGKIPVMAATLISDWVTIIITIPAPNSLPKSSGALIDMENPLYKKNKNKQSKNKLPTNPNSSANTAKMESLTGSGR